MESVIFVIRMLILAGSYLHRRDALPRTYSETGLEVSDLYYSRPESFMVVVPIWEP